MLNDSLIVGIESTTLSKIEIEMLQHPTVKGVILFSRNYQSLTQLKQLTEHIHSIKKDNILSIFTDQEGGRVQRFKEGFTRIPPMFDLVKYTINPTDCAYLLACELKQCGIDASFAPVVDIEYQHNAVIGNRAFSNKPYIVSQMSSQFIKGFLQANMQPTIKHFPGHGYVNEDSHTELPIDNRNLQDIEDSDMIPFRDNILNHNIAIIMTSHIKFPHVDEYPVTLSRWWLTDYLRKTLNYKGVIISDDLEMEAMQQLGSMDYLVRKAIAAGCNWLLVCSKIGLIQQAISTLETIHTPNPIPTISLQSQPVMDQERLSRIKQSLNNIGSY